ncbi:MAG: hypothetical protein U1G05_10900 [Kiritimatiellia bacterium]
MRVGADAAAQLGEALLVEGRPEHGAAAADKGGFDDHPVEMVEHMLPLRLLSAPPGGGVGDDEFLAEQMPAERGEEGEESRGFHRAGAERVGDGDVAGAHGVEQAGDAEKGSRVEFERIAEGVVHPPQDDVHRLQALQGLEEHAAVAHREIIALHQREAHVAGEIGLLEIGFVEGAGGQQHDAGGVGVAGREGAQAFAPGDEEGGQAADIDLPELVGQDAREHDAVFQRVPRAAGRLGPVGQRPPRAPGIARAFDGVATEMGLPRQQKSVARPQETRIGVQEPRRKQPLPQEGLRAV